MFTVYDVALFFHILGVIAWVGGVFTLIVLNARIAREKEPSAMAALGRQSQFFGRTVIGPAALVTLIAGIVMVDNAGLSFGTLWIAWGLVGIVVTIVLGVTVIRSSGERLGKLAATTGPGDAQVASLQRRLRSLNYLMLILLLSIVFAMVFKPTIG